MGKCSKGFRIYYTYTWGKLALKTEFYNTPATYFSRNLSRKTRFKHGSPGRAVASRYHDDVIFPSYGVVNHKMGNCWESHYEGLEWIFKSVIMFESHYFLMILNNNQKIWIFLLELFFYWPITASIRRHLDSLDGSGEMSWTPTWKTELKLRKKERFERKGGRPLLCSGTV